MVKQRKIESHKFALSSELTLKVILSYCEAPAKRSTVFIQHSICHEQLGVAKRSSIFFFEAKCWMKKSHLDPTSKTINERRSLSR